MHFFFFQQKNINVFAFYQDRNFNVMLANNVVLNNRAQIIVFLIFHENKDAWNLLALLHQTILTTTTYNKRAMMALFCSPESCYT